MYAVTAYVLLLAFRNSFAREDHSANISWIHNGQPSDIESVMVDGQFIMRHPKVLTMDEVSIVAEADKVGQRIWGQVQAAGPITAPRLPRPQ